MNQETYRRIVNKTDQSIKATVLRALLCVLSIIYSFVVRLRNKCYDWGILHSLSASVPVISVGNITAGGTGKTPMVIWLCNVLGSKGLKNAILTRGYHTQPGQISDEPAMLTKACPETTVIVNPNRVAGAHKAVSKYDSKVLVMDDGFQHRKLRRNLDIVLIDATCPFGYERVLPAGFLREPLKGLSRASAVVVTRADQIPAEQLDQLRQQITYYAGDVPIATTVHRHTCAISYPNQMISLDNLLKEKIFAFCGIGNPDAFFKSLQKNDIPLCGTKIFDDHHAYSNEDIDTIYEQAQSSGATVVLCTQKDWVKSALLRPDREGFVFAYLAMELDFLEGHDKIMSFIDNLVYASKDN